MKKIFDIVKLRFSSPLHLSRGREDFDESAKLLHSDTLASALFVAALHCGASDSEALDMLENCRLSSAFPFWSDEYFFPKPFLRLPFSIPDKEGVNQRKSYKKIHFLGKSWFEKMLRGEEGTIDFDKNLTNKEFLSEHPIGTIFKSYVTQRVTVSPDYAEDAKPFYTERLFFGEEAGLFVMVDWAGQANKDLFFKAFRILGDLGIGTDRSVGNGFFEPERTQITIQVPENPSHQLALGLFIPDEGELQEEDLENSAWGLIKRGGYIAGASNVDHITLRKRSIFMFEEGSVFPYKPLLGKKVDLRPDWQGLAHPVWRFGKPIFIPVHQIPETDED